MYVCMCVWMHVFCVYECLLCMNVCMYLSFLFKRLNEYIYIYIYNSEYTVVQKNYMNESYSNL